MSITVNDLKFKKAQYNTDLASNGGRMTTIDVGSTLFPDVTGAERVAGLTRYRKEFLKNEQKNSSNEKDLTFYSAKVWISKLSPAEDRFRIHGGTDTDVQSSAEGYSNWAGVGVLYENVSAGALSLQAQCETSDGFFVGIGYISDGVNGEFFTIDGVSWTDNRATLSLGGSIGLINSYDRYYYSNTATIYSASTIGRTGAGWTTNEYQNKFVAIVSGTGAGQLRRVASNTTTTITVDYDWTTTPSDNSVFEIIKTYVSQVIELGDVVAAYGNWVETGTGTYDEGNYPPVLYPVGTITETWTLTFTSSTAFTVSGAIVGSVGTGSVSADFQPSNGSSYYFKLRSAGWGGTWTTGNTIVFTTTHSAKGFWLKEIVPAASNPYSSNRCSLGCQGDTA